MNKDYQKWISNSSGLKTLLFFLLIFFTAFRVTYSQEYEFRKSSIRTGLGIGYNEGRKEMGFGLVYSIGWQKSLGEKERLRINPNITFGGFSPLIMTDVRDQFYRSTSFGLNLHYDLLKNRAVSLVTTGGIFVNYSRGILGTGGWHQENNSSSEYFRLLYVGAGASLAIRIAPENRRLAFEIRPLSLYFGNNGFVLGYQMFGIDFKLRK